MKDSSVFSHSIPSLLTGDPAIFLNICGYVLNLTTPLRQWLHDSGYHFRYKSDFDFVRTLFSLLRNEFSVAPPLSPEQFLTHPGFVEKKLDVLLLLITNCRQKHKSLVQAAKRRSTNHDISIQRTNMSQYEVPSGVIHEDHISPRHNVVHPASPPETSPPSIPLVSPSSAPIPFPTTELHPSEHASTKSPLSAGYPRSLHSPQRQLIQVHSSHQHQQRVPSHNSPVSASPDVIPSVGPLSTSPRMQRVPMEAQPHRTPTAELLRMHDIALRSLDVRVSRMEQQMEVCIAPSFLVSCFPFSSVYVSLHLHSAQTCADPLRRHARPY